ncbi:hypothetical protein KEM55_002724 [Ascosphaera atra]|nr:hypothetical protein KEM55_002724 [Ascosphaera atra]
MPSLAILDLDDVVVAILACIIVMLVVGIKASCCTDSARSRSLIPGADGCGFESHHCGGVAERVDCSDGGWSWSEIQIDLDVEN